MKRGRPKLPLKLPTPEQEAWIRKYYNNYTRDQLSKKLNIPLKLLRAWLKEMNVAKKRGSIIDEVPTPPPGVIQPKPLKQIVQLKEATKPTRPRPDHTNMSREQRIDYWINYPI